MTMLKRLCIRISVGIKRNQFRPAVDPSGHYASVVAHGAKTQLRFALPAIAYNSIPLNKELLSRSVVKRLACGRQERTAEPWFKECKNSVQWMKLSCRTFNNSQTQWQLFALAYHFANFLRRLALPHEVKLWSLAAQREARQDGSEGDSAREIRDVPTHP